MDRETISAMIETHYHLVEQVARRHFSDRVEDQDLLQSGLIGLWEAAETWRGKGTFAAFARICIKHNMLDYVRGLQRHSPIVSQQQPEAGVSSEDDLLDDDSTLQAIRSWPKESTERKALHLVLRGYTKTEAAKKLGVSRRTVQRALLASWEKLQREKEKDL